MKTGQLLMTIRKLFLCSATVLAVAGVSALAYADEPSPNWTNFPGSKCVQARTSGSLHIDFARAENISPNEGLRVSCPIDRQTVIGELGDGSYVWVIDDHATESVTCSLAVRDMTTDTQTNVQTFSTPARRSRSRLMQPALPWTTSL